MKWMLFIVPALVIGGFETIRHTLLEQVLPMEMGNWITACIDAGVIAVITRTLLQQFTKTEQELNSERALRTILEERERLARVLHDQIAQSIFYSRVQIGAVQKLANENGQLAIADSLDDIRVALREMDENVRQAIFNLREDADEVFDLPTRFRSYLNRAFADSAVTWRLEFSKNYPDLSLTEQTQLFGILQEAVVNIIKHAGASEVSVSLTKGTSSDVRFVFEVSDNGKGFTALTDQRRRFGMEIVESRAREIGAEVSVDSGDKGTRLCIIAR